MAGAGMKDIKRRIRSVESTRQITKAMELVASSKMRRAKEKAEQTRPLFTILYETLSDIAVKNRDKTADYIRQRPVKSACFIVIAGDRGLAGGYNSNLFKMAQTLIDKTPNPCVIPIGRKAVEYFSKREVKMLEYGCDYVENVQMSTIFDMANKACELYRKKEIDELYLVYTKFVSALSQEPTGLKVLPLTVEPKGTAKLSDVLYEPSAEEVFEKIIPQYVAGLVRGAISESFASEQGARRTAMESASDNATEMIDSLSLQYNRARQASITQEITEIAGGAEALK